MADQAIFLLFALPIAAWVAFSDLTRMKIPNKAVLAMLAIFFFVGLIVLPLDVWAWRWAHFGVVIVLGFLLSSAGALGAGDAKYLAAMAPFIALPQIGQFAMILSAVTIITFVLHRALRRTDLIRSRFAHWQSVDDKRFPFGIALAPSLVIYLAIGALGV